MSRLGLRTRRIWQIRCDLEQQRAGGFTAPPIARIPSPRAPSVTYATFSAR